MRYSLTVCILLLLALAVQGQTFSTEPNKFVKDVTKYLKDTKREDATALADQFEQFYKDDAIKPSIMERIITSCNLMGDRNFRAFPQMAGYFTVVNNYLEGGGVSSKFNSWSDVLDKVITARQTTNTSQYDKFIGFSFGLLSDNIIFQTQSKLWKSSSNDWTIEFKDDHPVWTANDLDLIAYSSKDTIIIKETRGKFYPFEEVWEGDFGKIDWGDTGFPADKVFARFSAYSIDFTKAEFTIDTVTFQHAELFSEKLQGSLEEKLSSSDSDGATYPRFRAFRDDIKLDDIGPNISYIGGFALYGNRIIGYGKGGTKPRMIFKNEQGQEILKARSDEFVIRKGEQLSAQDAEISLYFGTDSLYHPGLEMVFKIPKQEMALYRGESGIAATPFFDSYHQHEIETDVIVWHLDENFININMLTGAGKKPATFTSTKYFRKGEIEKFQGLADFNIVYKLKIYSDDNQLKEFYAETFAKWINPKYSVKTIRGLLYRLVEEGFIFYDSDRQLITIKDKLDNYVLANADRIDYDVIKVNSYTTGLNGKIDLETNDIELNGVKQVLLSDSQDVAIFPDSQFVELREDRDMFFSGVVFAGRVDFDGSGFHFEYDSFKVDLTNLAAAIIYVPGKEEAEDGSSKFVPLKSKIEGLTGVLYIDHPENKSGKKRYVNYPIYHNKQSSYVYYEYDHVHDSAYSSEDFYFELEPFVFDSLDVFDPYLSDFTGKLVSAKIFPDFDENLKVQPDLSLGFKRTTPAEGYALYDGMANYTDSIMLSNNGLEGKGSVEYLFTGFSSDSIFFYPDSLDALADSFHMEKTEYQGQSFPLVKGADNDIHWLPYRDTMFINMLSTPFKMYEIEASMAGDLVFTTENGLKGTGAFEFKEAQLSSEEFNFEADELFSDTMALAIKAIEEDKVTFNTPNVNGRVDLANKVGEFKSNEADIETQFDNNQYKTAINEFTWDMEANILTFTAPEGNPSEFVSYRADQDSLRFFGTKATFDMSASTITVDGVEEVLVADARLIPDSNRVVINPGGLLDSLDNAVVIVDTATELHRIYDAEITINSKKDLEGSGTYDYQAPGMDAQPINMHQIGVNTVEVSRKQTDYKTYANGIIDSSEAFKLNKGIGFNGDVALQTEKDYLVFDGFAELQLEDTSFKTQPFYFSDEINPEMVTIHYDKPVSQEQDSLFTGFIFDPLGDFASFPDYYTAMMRPRTNPEDEVVFEANGIVQYHEKQNTWKFGDEKKLTEDQLTGNIMAYEKDKAIVRGEGRFDLGLDLYPFEMETAGRITHEIDSARYTFGTFLMMDFPIDKDMVEFWANDVKSFSFDKPDANYTTAAFEKAFAEFVNPKKVDNIIEELRKIGRPEKQKEMSDYDLVISNVDLVFDPNYQTYRSVGPISVSFIGDVGIHKQMTGYLEFGTRRTDDFFHLYLESTFDDYYFFTYENKTLQIVSSNEDFTKMIAAVPSDKRTMKLNEEQFYFYSVGAYGDMQAFTYRMNMIESGEDVSGFMPEQDTTEEDEIEKELEELKKQLLDEEDKKGELQEEQGANSPALDDEETTIIENTPKEEEAPAEEAPAAEEEEEKGGKKKNKKDKEEEPTPPSTQEEQQPDEGSSTTEEAPAEEEDVTDEEPQQTTEEAAEEEEDKKGKKKKKKKKKNKKNKEDEEAGE